MKIVNFLCEKVNLRIYLSSTMPSKTSQQDSVEMESFCNLQRLANS